MKKIDVIFLSAAISLTLIQGCSTVIPIKSQFSKIPEVTKCIADGDSHGQCNANNVFIDARISGSNNSYFEVLGAMELPDAIDNNKLLRYSGKSSDLNNRFNRYANKFKQLNYDASYNREAAKITQNALVSDSNKSIHELYSKQMIRKDISGTDTPTIEFNIDNFNAFLEDMSEADAYGGINSLQYAAMQRMSLSESQTEIDALGSLVEELSYTKAYFKAYFRHGKFIQGKIKVSELYNKLKAKLKSEAQFLTDDQITEMADGLFKKLTGKEYAKACTSGSSCEIAFAGKLEATQFVTRAGVEYGFPHITVSVDPLAEKEISVTEIDWNKVGAEVAKVYIEAVGDKLIGLPADPRSTACKINSTLCYSEKTGGISADDFASVGEHADKVDTLVSNAVGKAIRGGGWISLNNEAIASIIESAVGTAAKKVAEKVAYCTYSYMSENKNAVVPSMTLNEIRVKITR